MVFTIIGWLVYGLIVGLIAKAIYRGPEPQGWLSTIGVGVAGSFVGNLLAYLIGWSSEVIAPSGVLFGIVGAVLFLWIYSKIMKRAK